MENNKIKIDLYKSKTMARFSHYVSGNLYYNVDLEDGTYQFPIMTVEEVSMLDGDESGLSMYEYEAFILSSDLGTTSFGAEIKGSDLNRWISKANDKGEFIKIK